MLHTAEGQSSRSPHGTFLLRFALLAVVVAIVLPAATATAQDWSTFCPTKLKLTQAQLASLGIFALEGPYCIYVPENTTVRFSAEQRSKDARDLSIVVAVPGAGPGGYTSHTVRSFSTNKVERAFVLTTTAPTQVLYEFHEGSGNRPRIWRRVKQMGEPEKAMADYEAVSNGQSLHVMWPQARPDAKGVSGPQTKSVTLRARRFCSDATTEDGADEVYTLALGRRSDGATYAQREPGDFPHDQRGHWDMNDGNLPEDNPNGDAHCRTNKTFFSGNLDPGQSWNVQIVFMEEDGGSSKALQEVATTLLVETGDPFAVAAGTIIGALTSLGFWVDDTDDWLGSVAAHIENSGGNIVVQWVAKERVTGNQPDPADPGSLLKREFRMKGDGSNFVAWLEVR